MSERSRIQEHTYKHQLPPDVVSYVTYMGTRLEHKGLVSVVRRIPKEHSPQPLSAFLADDAFFLNVWRALCAPDDVIRQRLKREPRGRVLVDSYVFYQQGFCTRSRIDTSCAPQVPDLTHDCLQVIVDFASRNFGTDAQTVTYFLTSHEISHGSSSSPLE